MCRVNNHQAKLVGRVIRRSGLPILASLPPLPTSMLLVSGHSLQWVKQE
jgi:hypothetical protein